MARWETLEEWSPTLFLVAGGLLAVYAVLNGIGTFLDMAPTPMVRDVLLGPAGFFLGLAALLGLYPAAANWNVNLARAGAVFAALGAVGWLATPVTRFIEHSGGNPPGWLGATGALIPLGFLFGFLIFSVASFRSDALSRAIGVALLLPVLGVFLNLGLKPSGLSIEVGRVIVTGWFALAHLAIGFTLRTETTPTDHGGPTAEPAP